MCSRAIVVVAEKGASSCLDRLVDRPWFDHLIEQLIVGGIANVDVLAPVTARVVGHAGDGSRWGVALRCHDADGDPPAALAHLLGDPDVLLVDAAAIVDPAAWTRPPERRDAVVLYYRPRKRGSTIELEWTGWCRGQGRAIAASLRAARNVGFLPALRWRAPTVKVVSAALVARDPAGLLAANAQVLARKAEFVSLRGQLDPAEVWVERGVRVHETARLYGPVYLGEHVEVGPGVVLGPNAVVGEGTVLEAGTNASDCVLPPATYVKQGTTCERVVGLESGAFGRISDSGSFVALQEGFVDLRRASLAADLRELLGRAQAALQALAGRVTAFIRDGVAATVTRLAPGEDMIDAV